MDTDPERRDNTMTNTSKPRDDFTVQVIRTVDDGHAIYHLKIPMLGDGLIQRGAALERFLNRPCTPWGGRGTSARTDAGGLMRASSMDLRERVLLDSDAGMKAADVAAKSRVSGSWVRLLKQRRRDTGEVAPRVQRQGRRGMLAPPLHTLAALMAAHPDSTRASTTTPPAGAGRPARFSPRCGSRG